MPCWPVPAPRKRLRAWTGVSIVAALLALPPGAAGQRPAVSSPAGSGTGSIAGRVIRADGLPQPDAEVVLARRDRQGALTQLPWRARTAFDGRYRISGAPAGQYLVLVRGIGADDAMPGRPHPTLFPGVPVSEPGVLVEILAGIPTEGIDVWLWPYPRRFTVAGRVFGPDGNNFDSLVLEFGRPGTRAADVWTRTEPGGLFYIDTAPPGPIVFRARATMGDRTFVGVAATTVAVAPVEDVEITVREPVPVEGRVRVAAGGALPAGLSVALVPEALRPSALYSAPSARVGAEGAFRLRSETGRQTVVVEGLPPQWAILSVDGAGRDIVDVSDTRTEGVDILIGPRRRPAGNQVP
jgi:hypothetical protein